MAAGAGVWAGWAGWAESETDPRARTATTTAKLSFMASSPSNARGMLPRTVGVVLAGGASSRMGRDKALIELDGETLVAGAARARPGHPLLVLAVDLPRVPVSLLEQLARAEADLAIPRWAGGLEPLCALYGPAALAALGERVGQGRLDLRTLPETPGLRVVYLEAPGTVFLNLNRPGDLPGVETPG